ncbi:MAG: cupin domain-containing protein [Planctomycetota bacterium]|nr:cupin domain-containing protein [Planctomycetota bacterium]
MIQRLNMPSLSLEEDDSFFDLDLWIGEPARGIKDALKSSADFLVARKRLDVHFRGRRSEVIRMVLLENKEIPVHAAKGNIIVQCLEGHVTFSTMGKNVELQAGHLFCLKLGEPHSLKATEDSSLLLTILFHSDLSVAGSTPSPSL